MSLNADIIAWAREKAGYKPGDPRILKDFPRLEDWENGIGRPTYPQLERLADKLKVPVSVFYFPERPDFPEIEETFRTLGPSFLDEIPPKIRLLLRKARAFQIGLDELNLGRNPADRVITKDLQPPIDSSVDTIANNVRSFLGVSLDAQLGWNDADTAFKEWRKAFYISGVYVFKDAFGQENSLYSGFSLYDDEFPIIYVNNSTARTRQIFTLFHELAHLLFNSSGVDTDNDDFIDTLQADNRRIEIVCNRLAAKTLVPDDFFDEYFEEILGFRRVSEDPREFASDMAGQLNVSREMIYRKLRDRELVSQEEYSDAAKTWAEQQLTRRGGGNKYYNWITYLGREYISLAFQRYYQNRITHEQLGDYLDIKPKNLDKLEDYLVRSNT
ncbi:MAG: ImmA/IrrE family metallo-endopeptidase [Candidatus Poribacteria bacterium]|nr:ImmA/IrrE family metallo-endopeptidase [Candidatus Poribacteria bacterium]